MFQIGLSWKFDAGDHCDRSTAEFGFDEGGQRNDVEDDVGEEHGAREEEIQAEIQPEFQIVVVRRVIDVVTLHQVVSTVGIPTT